jgi:LmbE family N-acetylglucosaminyl deacetylase
MFRIVTFVLTLILTASAAARDAAELQLAIRKLNVIGSALYIAAHPDDENTAMLAWLSNERLYRTAYLSVTRGDGGQNLIGQEQGPLLGVIRTEELLAARRIDHAEQRFTRAIDFGYSKSPEETLAIWGHQQVLGDVVWTIRRFQPDVIVTRFPVTGEGGHGQHTASAILAEEAFAAAGDPTKFPEQLRYVSPWSPRRIFWNRFSWRPIDPNDPAIASSLRVDLGGWNPLLGRAYTEIAAISRSEHKSQGFGASERRGTVINYFEQRGGDRAEKDLFEGIDPSWSRLPGGETLGALFRTAAETFNPDAPGASIPILLQALNQLDRLRAQPEWSRLAWIDATRQELLDVIRDCAGLAIDISAKESLVVPGAEIPVTVTVVNRSDYPFRLSMVASLYAAPGKAPGVKLEYNQPVRTDLTLKIPDDFEYSRPHWLRKPGSRGLYAIDDPLLIDQPVAPPAIPIVVTIDDLQMNTLIFILPAVFRWTDPVRGGQVREVEVVPPVTARFESDLYLFPDMSARTVGVTLRSFGAETATAALQVPEGWRVSPESQELTFSGAGDEKSVAFRVTPAKSWTTSTVRLVASVDGRDYSAAISEIDYPHIPARRIVGEATAKVVRADVARRGSRIGYIIGSGDDIPEVLRQVGYEVTLLSDADLDRGDFARFDAIVAGIRAYNTRKRLAVAHEKLMDYVANGGTYVVQYNTLDERAVAAPGPYPFEISRDRVTVEEAAVEFTDPRHPLLNAPNRLTSADFDGWVQERGLYFPGKWDPRYTTIISSHDPGETPKPGGQLVARHGKGMFVYTAYSWWRQLPNGVPGAIRAFVNLISAGRSQAGR